MPSSSYISYSSSESGLHRWVSPRHSPIPLYRVDSPISLTSAGKYRWTRSRIILLGGFIQYVSVAAFAAWSLYLWVNVKDYGSQPECNDQIKYVIFFVTVRATAPWLRKLWIAGFAALALGAVGLMLWFGTRAVKLSVGNDVDEAGETPTKTSKTPPQGETGQSKKLWYIYMSRTFPLLFSVS